jgi:heat shock protein HslJ
MRTILAVVTASLISALQGANAPRVEGQYWKAIELAGKPVKVADTKREPLLQLQGGRVSGADGCNSVTGAYELKGDTIAFSKIAATRMACPNTAAYERGFHAAIGDDTHGLPAGLDARPDGQAVRQHPFVRHQR